MTTRFASTKQRKAVMAKMKEKNFDYVHKTFVGVAPVDTKNKSVKKRIIGNTLDWKKDSERKAFHAGKRTSATGGTYYEHRANRSDVSIRDRL